MNANRASGYERALPVSDPGLTVKNRQFAEKWGEQVMQLMLSEPFDGNLPGDVEYILVTARRNYLISVRLGIGNPEYIRDAAATIVDNLRFPAAR